MNRILISDANILIDLEDGQLTKEVFQLYFSIGVVDFLFEEELAGDHGDLVQLGLQSLELNENSVGYLVRIREKYNKPSLNDLAALALAKQENGILLTGDMALRKVAEKEKLEVRGTVWFVEKLIESGILAIKNARYAFKRMKENGRRLPWEAAESMMKQFED